MIIYVFQINKLKFEKGKRLGNLRLHTLNKIINFSKSFEFVELDKSYASCLDHQKTKSHLFKTSNRMTQILVTS